MDIGSGKIVDVRDYRNTGKPSWVKAVISKKTAIKNGYTKFE